MSMDGPSGGEAGPTAPEEVRAHAIQRGWLDKAKGHVIQARLLDGKVLKGTLLSHDRFCLLLGQGGTREAILLYKQAIAYLSRAEER